MATSATAVAKKVIGFSEANAASTIQAAGFKARIVMVDGVGRIVTADYRTDRINLTLQNGIVTKADIG